MPDTCAESLNSAQRLSRERLENFFGGNLEAKRGEWCLAINELMAWVCNCGYRQRDAASCPNQSLTSWLDRRKDPLHGGTGLALCLVEFSLYRRLTPFAHP